MRHRSHKFPYVNYLYQKQKKSCCCLYLCRNLGQRTTGKCNRRCDVIISYSLSFKTIFRPLPIVICQVANFPCFHRRLKFYTNPYFFKVVSNNLNTLLYSSVQLLGSKNAWSSTG